MGLILLKTEQSIEKIIRFFGVVASLLQIPLIACVFLIVILRYFFSAGSVWLQELALYFHAISFLLAMAWALQLGSHVRVDVFYRGFSERTKAWINLVGHIVFLFPFCLLLIWEASDFVVSSWEIQEGSSQANGLDAIYLLKSVILVFPGLMILQGLASCLSSLRRICSHA